MKKLQTAKKLPKLSSQRKSIFAVTILLTITLLSSAVFSAVPMTGIVDARNPKNSADAISATPLASATATPLTFGYTTVGHYANRTPIGDKDSVRYQAPQSGTITSISMYITTANAQIRYGVYSDLNGQPDQLIAQSQLVSTGNGNSWITAPLTTSIDAGKYYWLTIISTSTVYWTCDGGALAGNGKDTTTLSPSYGAFTNWGNCKFSMYATYTTSPITQPAPAPIPTVAPTAVPQPTVNPTPSPTLTPSPTPAPTSTPMPVPTATASPTPMPTVDPTSTPQPTAQPAPTATPTPSPMPQPTATPTPTPSPTPNPTTSPTPTPTPTQPPTSGTQPVWSTNAEISSLSQLGISYGVHGNGASGDTVTVSTAQAHSGTRSFLLTSVDKRLEFNFYPGSKIQNDFYYSWWAYIPSSMGLPSGSDWLVLFQIEGSLTSGYYPIGKLNILQNGVMTLVWQTTGGGGNQIANSGHVLPRDQWVHFEWYTHIGTNGEFALWMNGVKQWDVTGVDTSGLTQSTMYFTNDLYGMNGSYYVDDMALYNVNMNGKAP